MWQVFVEIFLFCCNIWQDKKKELCQISCIVSQLNRLDLNIDIVIIMIDRYCHPSWWASQVVFDVVVWVWDPRAMLETLPLFGWSLHSPQLPCLLCPDLHQVPFLPCTSSLFFPLLHTLCYGFPLLSTHTGQQLCFSAPHGSTVPSAGSTNSCTLCHCAVTLHLLLLLLLLLLSPTGCLAAGIPGIVPLPPAPAPPSLSPWARAPLPSLCQAPHSPGSRGRGPGSPITEPPKTSSLSWFLFDQNCNNYKQSSRRATFYTVSISHLGKRTTVAIICFNQFNWTKCYSK